MIADLFSQKKFVGKMAILTQNAVIYAENDHSA
jgi:hypothetical protein